MCKLEEAFEAYVSTKSFTPTNLRKEINRYNFRIKNYWHNIELGDIKTRDIIAYRKYLTADNLKPQSIKHCLTLLRGIMRRALYLDLYNGELPFFEMPKINNASVRYLTLSEAQKLLTALYLTSTLWHDITLFALHTGMRAGEIFSIRNQAINFEQRRVIIFESKNGLIRTVPLSKVALTILQKYSEKKLTFFFSNSEIYEVSKVFRKAVERCELNATNADRRNKVVFHTLRHTFASWLVQGGTPLYTVSELLGHKSLEMTKRYAHLAPDQGSNAITLIPNNTSPLWSQENCLDNL